MASPLFAAEISLTFSSLINIEPSVIASRPAIILRRVDLPQPEGPTKTQNSPSRTSRSSP